MVPVLFQLGPIAVYSFGAMMAVAFLVSGYVVALGLGRRGVDPEHAWSVLFWAAIGGIGGSRLLVICDDWKGFLDHPIGYLLTGSGFIWYGGLIGGFLSVTLYMWMKGVRWVVGADAVAPGLALGHAIGRVGCQIAGDGDWGVATKLPWGMSYPESVIGWDAWLASVNLPPGTRVHPAPVYETLAYSAIFVLLWRLGPRDVREGTPILLYLALSSVARFLVEAIRVEPVVAFGLTQAQLIAIVLFVASLGILAVRGVRPPAAEAAA